MSYVAKIHLSLNLIFLTVTKWLKICSRLFFIQLVRKSRVGCYNYNFQNNKCVAHPEYTITVERCQRTTGCTRGYAIINIMDERQYTCSSQILTRSGYGTKRKCRKLHIEPTENRSYRWRGMFEKSWTWHRWTNSTIYNNFIIIN